MENIRFKKVVVTTTSTNTGRVWNTYTETGDKVRDLWQNCHDDLLHDTEHSTSEVITEEDKETYIFVLAPIGSLCLTQTFVFTK